MKITHQSLGYMSNPEYLTRANGENPALGRANDAFVETFRQHGLSTETANLVRDIFSQAAFVNANSTHSDELNGMTGKHIAFPYHFSPLTSAEIECLIEKNLQASTSSNGAGQHVSFDLEHNGFSRSGEFSCLFTLPQYIQQFGQSGTEKTKLADITIKLVAKEQAGEIIISYHCESIVIESEDAVKIVNEALDNSTNVYQANISPEERRARLQKQLDYHNFSTKTLREQIGRDVVTIHSGTETIGRTMLLDKCTKEALSPTYLKEQYGTLKPFFFNLKHAGWSAKQLKAADQALRATDMREYHNVTELKDAGFSAQALLEARFSTEELSEAGFTDNEINCAKRNVWFNDLPLLGFLGTQFMPSDHALSHKVETAHIMTGSNEEAADDSWGWGFDLLGTFGSVSVSNNSSDNMASPSPASSRTSSRASSRPPSPISVASILIILSALANFFERLAATLSENTGHAIMLSSSPIGSPATTPRSSPAPSARKLPQQRPTTSERPPIATDEKTPAKSHFGPDSSALLRPCGVQADAHPRAQRALFTAQPV